MAMTALKRKVAMLEKGVTATGIAGNLGITPSHVSQVVRGDRRSRRIEQAVADAIGKPVGKVFPKTGAA